MKKSEREAGGARRGFRLEWEENRDGNGRIFLFGVDSFGAYEENRKIFLTSAGIVTVLGERLSVRTFRSGSVEVSGTIGGVSFVPSRGRREGKDLAAD